MRSPARLALAVLSLAAVGCSDFVADPGRSAAGPYIPSLDIFATYAPDSLSADITVTPTGGTFTLGIHAVHFPAYSICATGSSYGPSEWDAPCAAATEDMNFHVEVRRDSTGRSWLDFSPSVRFVPSDDPSQWVMIYLTVGADSAPPPILWSEAIGAAGVDESVADTTLRSQYIPGSGVVYRRIKHFSGYNAGIGFMDSPIDAVVEATESLIF